jgi:dCMP deaminase
MSYKTEIQKEVQEALDQQDSKQSKLDQVFLNIAKEIATLSHCTRSKVGAVIVKDGNIISFGYNGMPKSMDNCCEDKMYMARDASGWIDIDTIEETWPFKDHLGQYRLITKSEVIHAESNAILKAAKNGTPVNDATLYLTMSPCIDCSKLILQSGIKRVVYLNDYHDQKGVSFLKQFIEVKQYAI